VAPGARDESEAEAGGPRLGGDDDVAVDQAQQPGDLAEEARMAMAGYATVLDATVLEGASDGVTEQWPHEGDVVACRQELGEQVRASGRVVREIEGEDGDLHAPSRRA